ncbi:hypothetical protein [Anaerobium acetethylicum]|uniref:Uncharacterized protein n=1 Tax=Anaerobium acetethylicum TaxID=1619234 RepID=A0A1D3TUL8_9FIRM|nr:hypothetical protein [Anaerobium acetethylicum]SCP97773.1 hypothetical protein SAMN05421730_101378 [Anaerobium acetethylicum]
MGYDLKEGFYDKRTLSNDEMWKTVNWLFSTHSVNETSYKFLFFKAIIDSFNKIDEYGRISLGVLFLRIIELSWNIILKYGIRQKAITIDKKECVLEQILHEYSMISLNGNYISWDEIAQCDRDKICNTVKSKCKRYVVGALFDDMNGLFYSFNKKEEWIEPNPIMVEFINEHKSIVENLNYYKWAKFYSKVNVADVERNLSFLLENGFARRNESIYRAMLAYEFERLVDNMKTLDLSNTIEVLLTFENQNKCALDNELADTTEAEYEDEMYDSFDKMREYLKDPILLINNMKKKKIQNLG